LDNKLDIKDKLHMIARRYENKYNLISFLLIKTALIISTTTEDKAKYLLETGRLLEQMTKYQKALEYYKKGLSLSADIKNKEVLYFLNNNYAYCLNYYENYKEAEQFSRIAIKIDKEQYNGYKNLGVSLVGQNNYSEAVEAFVKAVKLYPIDTRALKHLENLIKDKPELQEEVPNLNERLEECRKARSNYFNTAQSGDTIIQLK
jgi:tetratricopeptide (TPR) repeat protein